MANALGLKIGFLQVLVTFYELKKKTMEHCSPSIEA
jgi:hypothetical protein